MNLDFSINFFVLGAQKSGTSTLYHWLKQFDSIAMPWTKETHFFSETDKYSLGIDWYCKQFKTLSNKTKLIGEIDPDYMYFPECISRIKSITVAPKLIFVLRDPITRAFSHYQMSFRRGYEDLCFRDALLAEENRLLKSDFFSLSNYSYLDRGLYYQQISRFLNEFPTSEVLILKYDDLFFSQESAILSFKKICDFLDIEVHNHSVDVNFKANQFSTPRLTFIRNFIYGQSSIKKIFGFFIPSNEIKIKIMSFIDQLNTKPSLRRFKKNEIYKEVPIHITETIISDLQNLSVLLKDDFSQWINLYKSFFNNHT